MKEITRWPGVVLLVLLSVGLLWDTRAQDARRVAQGAFPSVVLLVMEDKNGQPISLGSGFFVRPGVVATNLHVIEGAVRGYARVVGDSTKYDIAGTVGVDRRHDLALLAVRGAKAPSLPLGESRKAAVGDRVYAVGNPLGLEGTFSEGIISGVRRIGSDTLLQITAPISPGSSGGPLLNAQGQVIGVVVATFREGQNLNFAIPSGYLASLLATMKPVQPLSSKPAGQRERSMLESLGGGRSTEGVVGDQFTWDFPIQHGNYSFSLRNRLRSAVTQVYCLVIFYDPGGNAIDFDVIRLGEVIPPGLAKRITGSVDASVEMLNSPYPSISVPSPPRRPKSRVEIRVLDFKILE